MPLLLGRCRLGLSPLRMSAPHLLPAQAGALPRRIRMAGWFKPGCRMARWSPTIAAWLATRPSRPVRADARIGRPTGILLTGGRATLYESDSNLFRVIAYLCDALVKKLHGSGEEPRGGRSVGLLEVLGEAAQRSLELVLGPPNSFWINYAAVGEEMAQPREAADDFREQ